MNFYFFVNYPTRATRPVTRPALNRGNYPYYPWPAGIFEDADPYDPWPAGICYYPTRPGPWRPAASLPRLRYLNRLCLFYTKYHKVGRAGIVGGGGHGRAKKEKDSRKKSKSWFLSPISVETERPLARNFARLARKFDRSTKLELEIARKNLARKRLELDIARKRFCSNSLARNMPCSFLLGFAR